MDYSLKDAFKSLKDVSDNIEVKHQKVLKEDLEEEVVKEGYVGQTVREFLEDCIEADVIEKIQIADNDAADFTVAFEGSYDDIPENLLEGSFDDFDIGGGKLVINAEENGGGSQYYSTVSEFLDDYNGDEIEIQANGETLFDGDKYDIPEELQEYGFVSFDAPEFICVNARELDDYNPVKKESIEEEILDEEGDRINLKRYGFVRAPEEDFSDDGNRFTCYYYDPKHEGDKRFRTSKLVSNGDAYISVHYRAPSGRTKYFDDLNGVSISNAVAGIPDLVKELDEFKEKELDAFSVVKTLNDNEIKQIADEIKVLMDRAGLNKYAATERAYHNLGIEYDTVPYDERRKVDNYVRNNSPYDKVQLEGKVKEVIKSVIHDMSSHSRYGFDRKWIDAPAKSIDDAIRTNMGGLSEYPDAVKEKVAKYIKDKLEDLFNFKDESLEEDISEDTIDAIAHEIVDELEEQGLIEQLNESWVNLADSEKVEEEKEKQEKEKDEEPTMQIVDPSATIVDELQDNYLGYAALLCVDCKTAILKKPEELEKTETVNPETGEKEVIYNVGFECPHCGSKNGYDLQGQIAALNVGEEQPVEEPQPEEPEEEIPEEEQPTPAPKLEVEDDDETEEETFVGEGLTDFDEVSFDKHINRYLKEVYDNVVSYKSVDGSIDGNTIIIEGLVKFNTGKENKTTFRLTLNGTSTVSGLNESFAKENGSYAVEGKVENNTFITENINYKYKIEDDLVEGCTKETITEESNYDKVMKIFGDVEEQPAEESLEEAKGNKYKEQFDRLVEVGEMNVTHSDDSEGEVDIGEGPVDNKIKINFKTGEVTSYGHSDEDLSGFEENGYEIDSEGNFTKTYKNLKSLLKAEAEFVLGDDDDGTINYIIRGVDESLDEELSQEQIDAVIKDAKDDFEKLDNPGNVSYEYELGFTAAAFNIPFKHWEAFLPDINEDDQRYIDFKQGYLDNNGKIDESLDESANDDLTKYIKDSYDACCQKKLENEYPSVDDVWHDLEYVYDEQKETGTYSIALKTLFGLDTTPEGSQKLYKTIESRLHELKVPFYTYGKNDELVLVEELEESCSDKELVDKLVAFGTCADEKEAKERVAKMSKEDKEKMCKSLSTQAKDHLLNDSLKEEKQDHEFEVGWYEGLSEEEAKRGDPVFKKFNSEKDAQDYYELIKDDEGKFGFFINEWDEKGELVKDIL